MTEITDAQVAETQWASSEQGMAAVKAACDLARSLGLIGTRAYLTESDIGAIVYAAYLAAGWDAGPAEEGEAAPAHDHQWAILGTQEVPPVLALIGKPVPRTAVLLRCTECGEPDARMLPGGEWTLEGLRRGDQP